MSDLIVGQVDVFHGEQRQLVGPVRVAPVLHVAGDGEQLDGRHDVRRGVDHDLVRRLEADRVVFAQVERVQGTIRWVLPIPNRW